MGKLSDSLRGDGGDFNGRWDAAEVKSAANGRWTVILPALTGIDAAVLDEKKHPCPKCGGTDRFRCLDAATGALFCNQCFNAKNGDGFAAIQWLTGWTFPEALQAVAESLNLPGSRNGHATNGKARGSAAKPKAKTSSNGKAKLDDTAKGKPFATADKAKVVCVAGMRKGGYEPGGEWEYYDAAGEPVALVLRFDKPDGSKEFRPVSLHDGGWFIKAPPGLWPLYNLPAVITAATVYVCEGEKTAEAARSLGLVAVTSMNGALSPDKTDWTPLAGKNVVILPDNDEPGRKYAAAVAAILAKVSPSPVVKIVELPKLTEGDDLVEWIAAHGDAAEPDAMRHELEALADAVDTIKPERPEPLVERFEPFPVDALPEPVRSFVVAGAKSLGCDESFIALPVLAMLGAAIGNTRRLLVKRGWTEPPILWTVIIGNSGSCKSPAIELALKPVKDRQRDAFRVYADEVAQHRTDELEHIKALDSWKRSKEAGEPPTSPIEPVAERYLADDTTVESLAGLLSNQPRGLLVARDELAGWMGGFDRYANGKGGDVAKWLEMFGGRSIFIDRKTGEPKTLFIPRAAVCLTGGIQPETLKRCLVQAHVENGLAARLLFAYPPSRPRRWTEAEVDEQLEAKFGHVVETLFNLSFGLDPSGESEPKLVMLSPDAKRRFQQFVNEHGAEHVELTDDLSAAWSKLEGYVARFALILHLARAATGDADESVVDLTSLEAGITLSRWFGREAKRIYAMLAESNGDGERRKLVEWIDRKGGSVTARELQMGPRRFRASTEVAELALDDLVAARFGRWEPIPTTPKGGRDSRRFVLATATEP